MTKYSKTPTLKTKPKHQRWIIADILLAADKPLTFGEIVQQARQAGYAQTFKGNDVTVEESVQWHLDKMMEDDTVKADMPKDTAA